MAKVFVALSGGVDSSVAAALLKERGFDVCAVHIKMWSHAEAGKSEIRNPKSETIDQFDGVCRQQHQDRIDAMRAAAHLGIPFRTWDFTEEYRRAVVEHMIREYAAGRTPNPDVMCNREVKFGVFLRRALAAGADYVATGHYVKKGKRHMTKGGRYALLAGADANKDQSYFLWTLTQQQLQHCLFPIGEYTKPGVRQMAHHFGLPNAEKPDSQGMCFIGEINVRQFLKAYIPERRGRVLTAAGRAVGEHGGVEFYTIGQRRGLGIGGGMPYYVTEKDRATNTLVVAEGPHDGMLFRKELTAGDVNWISGQEPAFPLSCEARIRYRQPLQRCAIYKSVSSQVDKFRNANTYKLIHLHTYKLCVVFDEPQRAIAPGQSIVFYRGSEMLGGAIIC